MKIGFEGHQESVELECLYVWKETVELIYIHQDSWTPVGFETG